VAPGLRRVWPVMSGGHGGQLDEGILAQRCHGFQGHVAGALHGPLIVLFKEDGTDESDDGLVIGEDANTSVRRLISPFTRSIGFVTGMKIPVPARSAGSSVLAYGATIREEGHREHAEWAGRCIR
jgi:hypothetical protein